MTSTDIRQSFLDFFRSKSHSIVPSSSLMPDSPNLLFTNAGMNQFVPYFLGERPAPFKRAADTQKCIRAGGKHNDLEDVGFDTYHHTFFEMLGNWSFGDYFKKEAIEWAWELLTQVWKFPKERLYATVYQPKAGDPAKFDQEAYDLWAKLFVAEGLDPAVHIRTGGKKDNFWMMGETGPCGPCSEIHIDLTPNGDSKGELVNRDSPYCIEIWNLVFMQFNAEPDGSFIPLKHHAVDTGMGFERVAGIIATTKGFTDFSHPPSNYNSDLFTDLFEFISTMSGHTYHATLPKNRNDLSGDELKDCIFRVLADHVRTLSFAIADGILPGNEGRNYVLRRILRRAVMWGKRLSLPKGFFARLSEPLIAKMSPFFPELAQRREIIQKVLANEEAAFDRTLDRGLALLDRITLESKSISGEQAFALYDTYGFPLDLTALIARERNLALDEKGFEAEMEKQRDRARAAQKKTIVSLADGDAAANATPFVGYRHENLSGLATRLLAVIPGPKETAFLVFEQTPFYAEMGGQIGDTGAATLNGKRIRISNTVKDEAGRVLHAVSAKDLSLLSVGAEAVLDVDLERRRAVERHHTATHLLHWALREVVGDHVRQAGSLVTDTHLRFDFSHFEPLSAEQIARIETLVNARIVENRAVTWTEVPFDEKPADCVALFGEKYGAVVRVLDVEGTEKELCGGTHVSATGEIGVCKILQQSAIAAGTRRLEAVAGLPAFEALSGRFNQSARLAEKLSCKPDQLETRIESLAEERARLEKDLQALRQREAAAQADRLLSQCVKHGALSWVVAAVAVSDPQELRALSAEIERQLGDGVVVLGAPFGPDKVSVLASCSKAAVAAGVQAGKLVSKLCAQLDGKGGGKPDFAMGGGKLPDKLAGVLDALRSGLCLKIKTEDASGGFEASLGDSRQVDAEHRRGEDTQNGPKSDRAADVL